MDVSFYDASDGSQIGSTQTGVANGSTAAVTWAGLSEETTYEWYAIANDGNDTTRSATWNFTTGSVQQSSSHTARGEPTDVVPDQRFNTSAIQVTDTDPDTDPYTITYVNVTLTDAAGGTIDGRHVRNVTLLNTTRGDVLAFNDTPTSSPYVNLTDHKARTLEERLADLGDGPIDDDTSYNVTVRVTLNTSANLTALGIPRDFGTNATVATNETTSSVLDDQKTQTIKSAESITASSASAVGEPTGSVFPDQRFNTSAIQVTDTDGDADPYNLTYVNVTVTDAAGGTLEGRYVRNVTLVNTTRGEVLAFNDTPRKAVPYVNVTDLNGMSLETVLGRTGDAPITDDTSYNVTVRVTLNTTANLSDAGLVGTLPTSFGTNATVATNETTSSVLDDKRTQTFRSGRNVSFSSHIAMDEPATVAGNQTYNTSAVNATDLDRDGDDLNVTHLRVNVTDADDSGYTDGKEVVNVSLLNTSTGDVIAFNETPAYGSSPTRSNPHFNLTDIHKRLPDNGSVNYTIQVTLDTEANLEANGKLDTQIGTGVAIETNETASAELLDQKNQTIKSRGSITASSASAVDEPTGSVFPDQRFNTSAITVTDTDPDSDPYNLTSVNVTLTDPSGGTIDGRYVRNVTLVNTTTGGVLAFNNSQTSSPYVNLTNRAGTSLETVLGRRGDNPVSDDTSYNVTVRVTLNTTTNATALGLPQDFGTNATVATNETTSSVVDDQRTQTFRSGRNVSVSSHTAVGEPSGFLKPGRTLNTSAINVTDIDRDSDPYTITYVTITLADAAGGTIDGRYVRNVTLLNTTRGDVIAVNDSPRSTADVNLTHYKTRTLEERLADLGDGPINDDTPYNVTVEVTLNTSANLTALGLPQDFGTNATVATNETVSAKLDDQRIQTIVTKERIDYSTQAATNEPTGVEPAETFNTTRIDVEDTDGDVDPYNVTFIRVNITGGSYLSATNVSRIWLQNTSSNETIATLSTPNHSGTNPTSATPHFNFTNLDRKLADRGEGPISDDTAYNFTIRVELNTSENLTLPTDLGTNVSVGTNETVSAEFTDSRTQTVSRPPTSANFTVSPSSPTTADTVRFDASGSNDPDGDISTYSWEFGDGSNGTGQQPSYSYDSSGDFTVNLTVTDSAGHTTTTNQTVSVESSDGGGGGTGGGGGAGGVTESGGSSGKARFAVTDATLGTARVAAHEAVRVRATVTNTGSVAGNFTAVLRMDGAAVRTRTVWIGAGRETQVVFEVPLARPGTVSIAVGNRSAGILIVEPARTSTATVTRRSPASRTETPPRSPPTSAGPPRTRKTPGTPEQPGTSGVAGSTVRSISEWLDRLFELIIDLLEALVREFQ